MSTENTNDSPQLPAAEAAFATIANRVHSAAFLAKLAELGHPAETEDEAMAQLELGFKLWAAEPAAGEKTATAGAGRYRGALEALDSVVDPQAVKTAGENRARAEAFQMLQDPEIYSAALVLTRAEQAAAA